jgi:hypothetical protein
VEEIDDSSDFLGWVERTYGQAVCLECRNIIDSKTYVPFNPLAVLEEAVAGVNGPRMNVASSMNEMEFNST